MRPGLSAPAEKLHESRGLTGDFTGLGKDDGVRRVSDGLGARRKGYLHLAMAAITCPCHIPIYLIIFGGTSAGAFLRENLWLFILGPTLIFLFTLGRASG